MTGNGQAADATPTRVRVAVILLCAVLLSPGAEGQACTAQNCRPPNCFCKGGDIPGGLPVGNTPQMVMVTFDDAVNQAHFPLYESLYSNKLNPGGCPARGTFYVCHDYSNYQMVQSLYDEGHEIASHSISHRLPSGWWSWASTAEWVAEIEGQREILATWANIPKSEIRGMRAPYLSVGGDAQFQMISNLLADNFVYDSSVVSRAHGQSAFISPTWPYTMDYPPTDECLIEPCPSQAFPGVWEIPLVSTQTDNGQWCSMEDECTGGMTENEVYDYLLSNFQRHYTTNRAPFGIFVHGPFLEDEGRFNALDKFMTDMSRQGDVFFVTAWQVIQWMKNPVPLNQLQNFFCPIRQNVLSCTDDEANFCQFDGSASLVNRKKRSVLEQSLAEQIAGNQTGGNQTFTNQTTGNLTLENQAAGNQTVDGNQTAGNQTAGNQTFVGQLSSMIMDEITSENQVAGNQTVNGNQTIAGNRTAGNQTVNGNQTIGGNQTAGNQTVNGNQTIGGNQTAGNQTVNGNQTIGGNQTAGNQTTGGNQTVGGNQSTGNQTANQTSIKLTAFDTGFAAARDEKFHLKHLGSSKNSPWRQATAGRRSFRPKRQAYNGWHNMFTCQPCPQSYPWLGNLEGAEQR